MSAHLFPFAMFRALFSHNRNAAPSASAFSATSSSSSPTSTASSPPGKRPRFARGQAVQVYDQQTAAWTEGQVSAIVDSVDENTERAYEVRGIGGREGTVMKDDSQIRVPCIDLASEDDGNEGPRAMVEAPPPSPPPAPLSTDEAVARTLCDVLTCASDPLGAEQRAEDALREVAAHLGKESLEELDT